MPISDRALLAPHNDDDDEGLAELCPVCGSERELAFSAVVLRHHRADYLKCRPCGFLGARSPTWLDEAYQSAIADIDTGVLSRTHGLEPRLICLLRLVCPTGAVFADIGAGYGVLVRTMRDAGLDFRWSDPHCPNLLARGFELSSDPCAALTAVEVLEHARDPYTFLKDALHQTGASVAVVTTQLLPEAIPEPSSWWYYALPTGQHISFFERRTLDVLADKLGLYVRSHGGIHVFHSGQVKAWQFMLASTRLAPAAATVLRRGLNSLTEGDKVMLEGAQMLD
jgi:hypothetical protein